MSDEPAETTEPPRPSRASRAFSALLGGDWTGHALAILLLAAVAVPGVWLLSPGSAMQRLPGDDALGTPAVGTIKASRDYDIPDEETTRRKRDEAVRAERSVYDFDEGAAADAAGRVHEAFSQMRDAFNAWRTAKGLIPKQPNTTPEQVARQRKLEEDAGVRAAFAAERDGFVNKLQLVVPDDDFALLGDNRFSDAAEKDLVDLVQRGLSGMIVQDRELLAAERDRGIVARSIRNGASVGERVVADLGLIRDTTQARDDVEKAASVMPETVNTRLRGVLVRLAMAAVRPTLVLNPIETQARQKAAAERVKPVTFQVKRGEKIIGDGERVEKRHLVIFDAIRAQTRELDLANVRVGGGLLLIVLIVLLWRFGRDNVGRFKPARKDGVLLTLALVGTMGMAASGFALGDVLHDRLPSLAPESFYYLVPFAAAAVLVRCVLSAEVALFFSVVASVAIGLLASHSVFFAVYALVTSLAASDRVARARDRGGIFRAGVAAGGTGALVVVATYLFTGRGAGLDMASSAAGAFLGTAFLMPVLVSGLLPLVEGVFGYVTDVKLLELANLNHPALKELIVQAPGTYHHSIIMGTLAESGATAIGANPLLAKVSAYYHDIGKTRNPIYFAENQRGENRHDQLAPSMSALIIKRHVTDGLEMARQYRLPKAVADAIPQHHGTRFVGYFWAKARKLYDDQAAEHPKAPAPAAEAPDEALFRYAGPKPQTREAALIMIADACEASSRALHEPTTDRLRAVVQKRINEVFSEGQLDECDLTLRDLNLIAGAFVRALEALYHTRPEYPPKAPPQTPVVGPSAPPASVHVLGKR